MRSALTLLFLSLLCTCARAQLLDQEGTYGEDWGGYLYGFKGGLSLGNQDWTGLETELLLGYHADLYYETIPSQGRFSFFGQAGVHTRGSRISRRRGFTFNGLGVTLPADDFRFTNLSLAIGAKSVFAYTRFGDAYYLLGLRADYSVGNNLGEYDQLENSVGVAFRLNYPFDQPDFINELTYGAIFGVGTHFPVADKIGGFVEVSGSPDFSFQYNQPPLDNIIDPFGGPPRTIGQRMIRNFTIEVSFGIRFLRRYEYIDK